ncbi:MAG TPA: histidine phosphatase family protein [Blastocatellia bacterium]|nr:histidine phosphatase family protein [Blastocatellia bacterium]
MRSNSRAQTEPESSYQRLFLIRHGAVNTISPSTLYGHTDVDLSELGHQQAKWLAKQLSGAPLSAIYSSDLKRSLDTAMPIAKAHELEITQLEDLREINMGRWEGRSLAELFAENQELVSKLIENPMAFCYPGGESFVSFENRVQSALSRIRKLHPNGTFAIVTHGGACRMIIAHVLDLSPQNWLRIAQDCGCINVIDWHSDSPTVVKINHTEALL